MSNASTGASDDYTSDNVIRVTPEMFAQLGTVRKLTRSDQVRDMAARLAKIARLIETNDGNLGPLVVSEIYRLAEAEYFRDTESDSPESA